MDIEDNINSSQYRKDSKKISDKKSDEEKINGGHSKKRKNNKKNNKSRLIKRIALSIFTALFVIVLGLLGVIYILEFGPSNTARNLFVNSAMESSAGKFMATMFLSDEKIAQIRKDNSVVASDDITDTSLINIGTNETDTADGDDYDEDGIQIIDISNDTYKGKMMIVKDPSRVTVGISGQYGASYSGKTVMDMAMNYDAVAAVNGGGFEDNNGVGNGGTPIGLVISDGELKYGSAGSSYEVIGFDNNNLVVGKMTASEALSRGVRDALSFGPILIVNGQASQVNGSGSGLNPRTAIGQRADGAILLLVIDGRQVNSLGASYADVIDVMLEYGAVNAANLDGGSSSLMYYKGEYINSCASLYGPRNLPTSLIVRYLWMKIFIKKRYI
uniref:phosphodiester glycosidase family protein n=1 Tax=Lachnospira sp. TaxID=2049031 RepID=UPI00402788A6